MNPGSAALHPGLSKVVRSGLHQTAIDGACLSNITLRAALFAWGKLTVETLSTSVSRWQKSLARIEKGFDFVPLVVRSWRVPGSVFIITLCDTGTTHRAAARNRELKNREKNAKPRAKTKMAVPFFDVSPLARTCGEVVPCEKSGGCCLGRGCVTLYRNTKKKRKTCASVRRNERPLLEKMAKIRARGSRGNAFFSIFCLDHVGRRGCASLGKAGQAAGLAARRNSPLSRPTPPSR